MIPLRSAALLSSSLSISAASGRLQIKHFMEIPPYVAHESREGYRVLNSARLQKVMSQRLTDGV
jgi:hypothetical protein